MSIYTKDSRNIYFLNDKNITSSLIDSSVLSNAIPSHKLFKDTYEQLSTYDNNLCIEVRDLKNKTNTMRSNLCSEIENLSDNLSLDLSNEISSRIKAVKDLSTSLSTDINSLSNRLSIEISSVSYYTALSIEKLCSEISANDNDIKYLSSKISANVVNIKYLSGQHDYLSATLSLDLSNEISSRIKAVKDLSTSLSNTADAKFVLKSSDSIEKLSVGQLKTTDAAIFEKNVEVKGNIVIGKADATKDRTFVWNGTESYYTANEIDAGGGSFNINPVHSIEGMFIGDKSLCAYITEDVALTATDIRKEINVVSTLLTADYALSSDVNTAINRIDNAGYLISNDFKFEYKDKALWLSAGSKTISVDATDFIVDGLLVNAEVSSNIDGKGDTPYLVLTFKTYKEGEVVLNTLSVSLAKVADIYESIDTGIEIKDYKVKLNYDVVAKVADTKQLRKDVETLSNSLSNTVGLSVKTLQDQIISNDNDIQYLSGQHDWLSNALSVDLSNEIKARTDAISAKANSSEVEAIKSTISSALSSLTLDSQLSDVITALSTIVEVWK